MRGHRAVRLLSILLVAMLLLAACVRSTPVDVTTKTQEPPLTAPSSEVSDVKVDIADCFSDPDRGGHVIRSESIVNNDYRMLYWGNEVIVTLTVLGDPIIAADMRQRISVTPAVDYQFAVVDQTADRQCRIIVKPQDLGDVEIRISGQPTIDNAPRFAQNLTYHLERTDEPQFALTCAEHPEIAQGTSIVVPPGLKHFTMTFTQSVSHDGVNAALKDQYQATEIVWASARQVNFTADMRWGGSVWIHPPVPNDERGIPFRQPDPYRDGGYIWVGRDVPFLTISGPNQVGSDLMLSSLVMDAVVSPRGDYAVLAEELPNARDEATLVNIWLTDLTNGSKMPIFEKVYATSPTAGMLWQPSGERFWVVEGFGTFADPKNRSVRLWEPGKGEIKVIPLNTSEGQYIRNAAVSPIDGSLVVGIAQAEGGIDNLFPLRLRTFSPDGQLLREQAAGWVPGYSRPNTHRMEFRANGQSVQYRNGYVKNDTGVAQQGTVTVNLATGEYQLVSSLPDAVFSPSGKFYVTSAPQKTVMLYRSPDEKIADLGVVWVNAFWSKDEKHLAYLDNDRYLMMFDTDTGQVTRWFDRPIGKVFGWTPKGLLVTEYEPRW